MTRSRRSVLASISLIVMGLVSAVAVATTPGDLDPTFGDGGKVLLPGPGGAIGAEILSDGQIIVGGGEFEAVRLKPNGVVDQFFGTLGRAKFQQPPGWAEAMVIQPDGKIVMAGWEYPERVMLVRFGSNGLPDWSFGNKGRVAVDLAPGEERFLTLALQADGKIVAGGWASGAYGLLALARFMPDGQLDAGFGDGGVVRSQPDTPGHSAFDLAIQPDGRIVIVGWMANCCDIDLAVSRYLGDGTIDQSFGTGGTSRLELSEMRPPGTPPNSYELPFAVALQNDGKIVVGGDVEWSSLEFGDLLLARFTDAGTLDPTFDGDGILVKSFPGPGEPTARDLAIQSDGRILVAGGFGFFFGDGEYQFQVLRFEPDGSLDESFGDGGRVVSAFGTRGAARSLAIAPDGRILAAGLSIDSTDSWAVARYLVGAPPPCTITGTNGDDNLIGTPGVDVICAGPGNDTIEGRDGNDVVYGGPGDDVILGGRGDDTLEGGPGRDSLIGGEGSDRLFGGADEDTLDGIDGTAGNDMLTGGGGTDSCAADPGDQVSSCP